MAFIVFSSILVSIRPGNILSILLFSIHMMRMLLRMSKEKNTSLLIDFTVWRLLVHHVVLYIIAWTKFAKAESPTNILNSLQNIFPTKESHPDYICINKACQVMWTAVNNRSWNTWKKTSCFIVDSYHYNNYHASDELCRKYCNPAPTDGGAPNFVGQKIDRNGVVHDVREFNIQTCEQLNAWLVRQ